MSAENYDARIWWGVFLSAFFLFAIWETFRPNAALSAPADRRWGRHALLFLSGVVLAAFTLRIAPVVLAHLVSDRNWGLLNRPWLPYPAQFAAAILLLDLLHYAVHRSLHIFPWLWRIHRIHHSDPDFDVSTAVRFHPVEVLLYRSAYLGCIALIAPPAAAVAVAELHASFLNVASHANVRLPARLEALLSKVLVTPSVHRVHHALDAAWHNRNFGQSLIIWDRLLGTFQPLRGAPDFPTGLDDVPPAEASRWTHLLLGPLRSK
jgi:sterol desaturase/sphingolipid hydroxylase (fatty acid hydroxylase superfamily)